MEFKCSVPILSSSFETDEDSDVINSNSCKICGSKASSKHYGVYSCQPCKTFFRRNGFRPELVRPCPFDGQCEVNILTRTVCASCRLKKCFAIGMKSELIRKEAIVCKKLHQKHVPITQMPTVNLLRDDKSLLTTNDWTLFSNIIHASDRFTLVPMLTDILKNVSSRTSHQIHFTSTNVLQMINSIYTTLQSIISCTPDYQILTINEQQSLFQRNIHGLSGIYSTFIFRDTAFLDNIDCYRTIEFVYGSETVKKTYRLANEVDQDSTLLKLILLIFGFSTNFFIVDMHEHISNDTFQYGTYRLFGSQNIYIELLWKYMLYRYGYAQTVIRFAKLITNILNVIGTTANVYMTNNIHYNHVNEIVEEMEKKLILDQNQSIPLWGKTDASN